MDKDKIPIDRFHARIFARAIYRDIGAYIQMHQDEYKTFLCEQKQKGSSNVKIKNTYRLQKSERKAR